MFTICTSHWLPVIQLMDPFFTSENEHIVAFKQCAYLIGRRIY